MRQGFIIANLFLISMLVLSGCATRFGANLACDNRAWSGEVKKIKIKTEKVICTSTPSIGSTSQNGHLYSVYGIESTTTCEPEYKVVLDSNQYNRFMKACIASMTKNK